MTSVQENRESNVEEFLRYTRDINEVVDPITRSTHLHKVKTIEDAKLLILAGAHLNLKNDDSKTVLFYVENLELFEFLVSKGASINICDRTGNSLLCYKKNPHFHLLECKGIISVIAGGKDTSLTFFRLLKSL